MAVPLIPACCAYGFFILSPSLSYILVVWLLAHIALFPRNLAYALNWWVLCSFVFFFLSFLYSLRH